MDADFFLRRFEALARLERAAGDISDAVRALVLLHRNDPACGGGRAVRALEGTILVRSQELIAAIAGGQNHRQGETLQ